MHRHIGPHCCKSTAPGLATDCQIAEKEIGRKTEVLQRLDYICQQFSHLKIVKSIPLDIGQEDRVRLANRAMDVRSACILYLAAQFKHDKTWLGTIGSASLGNWLMSKERLRRLFLQEMERSQMVLSAWKDL